MEQCRENEAAIVTGASSGIGATISARPVSYTHLGETAERDAAILILPYFIPCQKRLSETGIAFVIFPSNRGGYCIQPQKREYSLHYKCSFPERWLGLEKEELNRLIIEKAGLWLDAGEIFGSERCV